MKVIEVCQTPMLASEVYEMIKSDPKNEQAFLPIDPLDNTEISDPDQLRRLVSARRICGFLQDTYQANTIRASSVAAKLHGEFGLSMEIITRLIDSYPIFQGSQVYTFAILRDLISAGSVKMDQVESIQQILQELSTAQPVDEPPTKRPS